MLEVPWLIVFSWVCPGQTSYTFVGIQLCKMRKLNLAQMLSAGRTGTEKMNREKNISVNDDGDLDRLKGF